MIRPDVCSLGLPHSISLTPKYDAIYRTVCNENEKTKNANKNLVNLLLDRITLYTFLSSLNPFHIIFLGIFTPLFPFGKMIK